MKILSKHSNHDASELKEISLNFERMILRVRCKMEAIVRLPMDFRARLSNTFKYLEEGINKHRQIFMTSFSHEGLLLSFSYCPKYVLF